MDFLRLRLLSKLNIHCKIERTKKQLCIKMQNYIAGELKTLRVMIKDPR